MWLLVRARLSHIYRRFHPEVVLAAAWAAFAARHVRRQLKRAGVNAKVMPPPKLSRRGGRGVAAALRRLEPTCLERALVEQAWLASQGTNLDVVIGVPLTGMQNAPAHAWVDGRDLDSPSKYNEIHRLPPREPRPSQPA